jgi:hypothetical protein
VPRCTTCLALGFTEFKTLWSSSTDETVGSLEALTQLLTDILWDERARQIDGDLPEVAVVPIMKRKSFKQLGTPTAQATELAHKIKDLSDEELLKLAEEERQRQEEEGELDAIGDVQQDEAPEINDSLIGSALEVCWRCADHSPLHAHRCRSARSPPPQCTLAAACSLPCALICLLSDRRYWRKPTAEEIAKGEKRKKIGVKIWCEGEVVLIANGTTTTTNPENAKCKTLPKAGAVRIKWPADADREEKESFTWSILQEADWNQDRHLGWRFTAAELAKRAAAAAAVAEPLVS